MEKKKYVWLVFSRDKENGQVYWHSFSNAKAAYNCCNHYNQKSMEQGLKRWYFYYKEPLYEIW